MPDSQPFAQNSSATLAKLQEVDALLAAQEAQLQQQLANVQRQRQSLTTVISLFNPADTTTTLETQLPVSTAGVAEVQKPEAENAAPATPVPEAETATAFPDVGESKPTSEPKSERTTATTTSRNKPSKSRGTKTAARQSLKWQQYLRQEFQKTSLPEAVHRVLYRQAERILDIPTIVNAIFEEPRPQEVQNKVRHQITNILTEGVKKHKWYRPQPGYYSLSPAGARANSTS